MKIPALKKFDQISDKARESIYALVMKHYQRHPNSPWSGRYLVELEESIKKFYQEMGAQYQGAFRDTLPDMMKEFYDRAKEEIKTAGTYRAIKGEPDVKRIKYFMDNSFEQVAMRTDRMSFDHIRSLRQISAEVFREMAVTGHTRREVSKALFERAMKIPGFEFTDKAGSKWQAKSYFNMLARTELMNASRECYDDKMSEEGFDVMRLTVSGDPCDSCSRYENRLFSLTGATAGLPTKADLEAAGVFHPNCTHTYVLVPDFIRMRDYNPDGTKKDKSTAPIVGNGHTESQYKAKAPENLTRNAKKLKKELEKSGASPEQVDEILWNYTPEMEKVIGERPTAKFILDIGVAGTTPGTRHIEIDANPLSWNGCRQTLTHEFGHVLYNSIFLLKKTHTTDGFIRAFEADKALVMSQNWKDDYFGCIDIANRLEEVQETISQKMFNKKFEDLSLEQQWKIVGKADILGSLTDGEYGFGHTGYSFSNRDEVFADIYLAKKYNWEEYSEFFPELWKYIGNFLK